jgi:hypothetical protein
MVPTFCGNLPDGLELDSLTGIISGFPLVADSFDFTIKVTDSSSPNKTDTQPLFILVEEGSFTHGDANHDLEVDVDDVVYLINYLYRNGPEPIPLEPEMRIVTRRWVWRTWSI